MPAVPGVSNPEGERNDAAKEIARARDDARTRVANLIEKDLNHTNSRAQRLHKGGLALIWLNIIASATAALLGGLGEERVSKWIPAGAAPVALLAIVSASSLKPEQRSKAHLSHIRRCQELRRRLLNDDADPSEIERLWISSNSQRDSEWPGSM